MVQVGVGLQPVKVALIPRKRVTVRDRSIVLIAVEKGREHTGVALISATVAALPRCMHALAAAQVLQQPIVEGIVPATLVCFEGISPSHCIAHF